MTRYVSGRHIETATVSGGKEWERDIGLIHAFPASTLEGFNIRLGNATFRPTDGLITDIDESRIILSLSYTLPLF